MPTLNRLFEQIKFVPQYEDIMDRLKETTVPEHFRNLDDKPITFTLREIDQMVPRYAD